MSTVTAHTLFSRAARHSSAGAASLGGPKPAVVSLPFAPNSGKKKTRFSVCCYPDTSSIEHPSKIPLTALMQKNIPGISRKTIYGCKHWQITEEETQVELTFVMPPEEKQKSQALKEFFTVNVDGNVLKISKKKISPDDISFDVELVVPEIYNKDGITAKGKDGNLQVTIPKYTKNIPVVPSM